MMLFAAPVVGRVSERIGSKLPLAIGGVLAAGALLGMALAHDSAALVVLWGADPQRRHRLRVRRAAEPGVAAVESTRPARRPA